MQFSNGKYRVQMSADGAILVKPGDWLSKYSAAIHNDFVHIEEYGRLGKSGMERVADVNRIFAGETLYHLPTWTKSQRPGVPAPKPKTKTLSEDEKKRIVKAMLEKEYNLRGERAKILSKAIDIIGYAENAATLAEVAGLLAEGSAAASVATGLSIVSALLFPVGATISLINAWETGERMYGMRAIAYTTTAWAFNDPVPKESATILRNVRNSGLSRDIPQYNRAWQDASQATIRNLEQELRKRRLTKKAYQAVLQALGDRNRQKLCRQILVSYEKELNSIARISWQSNYKVEYPR